MNTAKLIAAINAGLQAEDAWDKALTDAVKAAGDATRDEVRVVILPVIAAKYKCAMQDGKGKAEGTKVLVRDRKSTRLNSSHSQQSRMPSSA